MLKYCILFLILGISLLPAVAQEKKYLLINYTGKARINLPALRKLDRRNDPEKRRAVFDPVKGKRRVYVFMATFMGTSYTGATKEFHDIVAIETDDLNRIVDGFHYTLEWAEMPYSSDLFRLGAPGMVLQHGLRFETLQWRRHCSCDIESEPLKETGVFLLK